TLAYGAAQLKAAGSGEGLDARRSLAFEEVIAAAHAPEPARQGALDLTGGPDGHRLGEGDLGGLVGAGGVGCGTGGHADSPAVGAGTDAPADDTAGADAAGADAVGMGEGAGRADPRGHIPS